MMASHVALRVCGSGRRRAGCKPVRARRPLEYARWLRFVVQLGRHVQETARRRSLRSSIAPDLHPLASIATRWLKRESCAIQRLERNIYVLIQPSASFADELALEGAHTRALTAMLAIRAK